MESKQKVLIEKTSKSIKLRKMICWGVFLLFLFIFAYIWMQYDATGQWTTLMAFFFYFSGVGVVASFLYGVYMSALTFWEHG